LERGRRSCWSPCIHPSFFPGSFQREISSRFPKSKIHLLLPWGKIPSAVAGPPLSPLRFLSVSLSFFWLPPCTAFPLLYDSSPANSFLFAGIYSWGIFSSLPKTSTGNQVCSPPSALTRNRPPFGIGKLAYTAVNPLALLFLCCWGFFDPVSSLIPPPPPAPDYTIC